MNAFLTPGAAWTQGLSLWCRLYQAQLDGTLRVWAVWASALPKPDARTLSQQAAQAAETAERLERPRNPRRAAAPQRMLNPVTRSQPETVH